MQSVQICDPSDSEQAKQICGEKKRNKPACRRAELKNIKIQIHRVRWISEFRK